MVGRIIFYFFGKFAILELYDKEEGINMKPINLIANVKHDGSCPFDKPLNI